MSTRTLLVDGWALFESPEAVRLERSPAADQLVARKRLITALGSLSTAAALTFGGLQAPAGIGLIVWPLVGLFLLVAGLGIWAFFQARMAIARPLFLEVRADVIRGFHEETLLPFETQRAAIAHVALVQEPGLTVRIAKLRVVTLDGSRFAGPELFLSDDEARAQLAVLRNALASLSARIGCPAREGAQP